MPHAIYTTSGVTDGWAAARAVLLAS